MYRRKNHAHVNFSLFSFSELKTLDFFMKIPAKSGTAIAAAAAALVATPIVAPVAYAASSTATSSRATSSKV